jgi:hypothetical protein
MTNALVPASTALPAEFQEMDMSGYEETLTQDDVAIPFLQVLQSLSPQCVEGDPLYNEAAKAGMLYNTVTGELMDVRKVPLQIIPITYKSSVIEWITRAQGGGFVKEYAYDLKDKFKISRNEQNLDIIQQGSEMGKPGNQLNITHTHVFGIVRGEIIEPAVATMTSTQIKSSKNLNALIKNNPIKTKKGLVPLRFAHLINASTLMRSNDQGKWFVWDFERVGFLNPKGPVFSAAREFADAMNAGVHKVDYSQQQSEGASAAPGGKGMDDEEVPF